MIHVNIRAGDNPCFAFEIRAVPSVMTCDDQQTNISIFFQPGSSLRSNITDNYSSLSLQTSVEDLGWRTRLGMIQDFFENVCDCCMSILSCDQTLVLTIFLWRWCRGCLCLHCTSLFDLHERNLTNERYSIKINIFCCSMALFEIYLYHVMKDVMTVITSLISRIQNQQHGC